MRDEVKKITIDGVEINLGELVGKRYSQLELFDVDRLNESIKSAKAKRTNLGKLRSFLVTFANDYSQKAKHPFKDLYYLLELLLNVMIANKKSGVPAILKYFSFILPKDSREEYLADLFEMNAQLKLERRSRLIIFLINILHFTSIVYHGIFFKLKDYFYAPKREKAND